MVQLRQDKLNGFNVVLIGIEHLSAFVTAVTSNENTSPLTVYKSILIYFQSGGQSFLYWNASSQKQCERNFLLRNNYSDAIKVIAADEE